MTPDLPTINHGEKWLVCGGREFDDYDALCRALDALGSHFGFPQTVIEGGQKAPVYVNGALSEFIGADYLARRWATARGLDVIELPANWKRHGKAAGPRRNGIMLELLPSRVIAFPGGNGTADMVRRAMLHPSRPDVHEVGDGVITHRRLRGES